MIEVEITDKDMTVHRRWIGDTLATFVLREASEAGGDLWVQREPGKRNDEVWINMGAGGLGDSLLGLCAVKGFKAANPERVVVYRIHRDAAPFVRLFDGYDGLAAHIWDEVKHDVPSEADPRDWQINAGYRHELLGGAQITRLDRYCKNLGVMQPVMPVLRQPKLPTLQTIVLCPFAAWPNREYPIQAWITLEALFRAGGFPTLVIGNRDMSMFTGGTLNDTAEVVTATIAGARLVIANDSGLAHLAGVLGVPTVVLCGWSVGARIYGFYPSLTCLQGMLHCNGCWTASEHYDEKRCTSCANLATVTPDVILRNVMPLLGGNA